MEISAQMPWKKNEPMNQRIEFCLKAVRGGNFRALCREYGISAKSGYKWQERFLRHGIEGMEEESRRPPSHPERIGEQEVCRMVGLKVAHPNWGPRKIRELYHRKYGRAASESSFQASAGTQWLEPEAEATPGQPERAAEHWKESSGTKPSVDRGLQRLVA